MGKAAVEDKVPEAQTTAAEAFVFLLPLLLELTFLLLSGGGGGGVKGGGDDTDLEVWLRKRWRQRRGGGGMVEP